MTITKKVLLSFTFLCFFFIVQGAFLLAKSDHIHTLAVEVKDTYQPVVSKSYELNIAVIQIQQWLTDISATRGQDGLDDGFEQAEENYQIAQQLVRELSQLDSANQSMYNALLPSLRTYYEAGKLMAQAYISEGPSSGNKQMANFDEAASAMTQNVSRMMVQIKEQSKNHLEAEVAAALSLERLVAFSSLLFLILLIVAASFFFKLIIQPIAALSSMAKDLAQGEGDLTKRLDASKPDELGEAARWINLFVEKSQQTVRTIGQVSNETQTAVGYVSDVAHKANSGMSLQLQEAEQVATAMHEMLATAQDIAQSAASTARETEEAKVLSTSGVEAINRAVTSLNTLVSEMDNAQQVIEQLESESTQIGAVLDVIKGISEQTNLLALNAAIEAARAGEQGRGFAVVADEVRTLASRTQQSTEEIQAMTTRLQQKTNEVTNVISSGSSMAHESMQVVSATNDTLNAIGQSIDGITEMSIQIATSAEQQNQTSGEIDASISQIVLNVKGSAERVEALDNTSNQLSVNTEQLKALVGQFKV